MYNCLHKQRKNPFLFFLKEVWGRKRLIITIQCVYLLIQSRKFTYLSPWLLVQSFVLYQVFRDVLNNIKKDRLGVAPFVISRPVSNYIQYFFLQRVSDLVINNTWYEVCDLISSLISVIGIEVPNWFWNIFQSLNSDSPLQMIDNV